MSEPAKASSAQSTPTSSPDVRSAGCFCAAASGSPCTPDGDHLDRYVRAAKHGTIDREALKQAVGRLAVIAPQAVVPTATQGREGVKPADGAVRSIGQKAAANDRKERELEAGA